MINLKIEVINIFSVHLNVVRNVVFHRYAVLWFCGCKLQTRMQKCSKQSSPKCKRKCLLIIILIKKIPCQFKSSARFKIKVNKILHRHKDAAATLKGVMQLLRQKQKEVEKIEAQLAKMMDELRVSKINQKINILHIIPLHTINSFCGP